MVLLLYTTLEVYTKYGMVTGLPEKLTADGSHLPHLRTLLSGKVFRKRTEAGGRTSCAPLPYLNRFCCRILTAVIRDIRRYIESKPHRQRRVRRADSLIILRYP